jgi:electron transport complex protein RnfB
MPDSKNKLDRRAFVGNVARCAGVLGLGGTAVAWAALEGRSAETVWQIDPDKCTACGNCQTHCVLDLSAVKCVQCFLMCGYCDVCTGYFPTTDFELDSGAKNELCPTGAVVRKWIEEKADVRYFQYTIDEPLCIGCGKCVEGCALMNGSLYLQVRHDRCLNCNECAIEVACPAEAFRRVPADKPYLLKKTAAELEQKRAQDG